MSSKKKQQRQQGQTEAEASRKSLEAGGLPLKAVKRLSEEKDAGYPLFTSDLSVNELLLIRGQGYQPLSQVMGSSLYHVGLQFAPSYGLRRSAPPQMQELSVVSDAHQKAAKLALGRLQQEAMLLNAHGVVGVRFTRREYGWGKGLLEYTAIGTAVKLPNTPLPIRPFLSDLSGQAFWKLLQAGYYPAGIVTGYCSYNVVLGTIWGQRVMNVWYGGSYSNQEIAPFAQGIATARKIALKRASDTALKNSARGIVGMQVDMDREMSEYETEDDQGKTKSLNLIVHFAVVGTAIRMLRAGRSVQPPTPTLVLTDLRPGRYGQNRELTFDQ
ncbi:MAG TPA: heavy metal-binding domain-containing protein [Ktedonobacteraceae bacterium]|nr:heavy metal-binding domain-containing protein [Ktedonobacteraceae bacterium]